MKDFFSIQDINSNRASLAKILLIFYIFTASGCTENLLSKQLKEYINSNRMIQHFVGFLTLVILVTLVGGISDNRSVIVYSLIGYTWFILSTKMDIHWNIIVLALLFAGYMYENDLSNKEKEILSDPNLPSEKKEEILLRNNNHKTIIVGSVIIVTIIGTIMYSYKKHGQHGGGYDIFKYMFY